jgi:phosphatidylserine decarboxylase
MVRDGIPIVITLLLLAAATIVLGFIFYQPLLIPGGILAVLGAFVAYFFRDPKRTPPAGDDLILSPADGKVVVIEPAGENETLVSIFLSVFDVHVNRAPIAGKVTGVDYREGRSGANERERRSKTNRTC